jgi:hypothetical protein
MTDLAAYYSAISVEPLMTRDEEEDAFKLLADKGLSA